jgi:hypothetical protein
MYIHNYQIHNVLNEYRKQLSRCQVPVRKNASAVPESNDRMMLSDEVQRQSIIEQVSSDIVERIRNSNTHQSEAGTPLSRPQADGGDEKHEKLQREKEFTYTLIDEFNRKMTHKLLVRNLKPLPHLTDYIQIRNGSADNGSTGYEKRSLGIG